jgi:hypothetical protein
MLRLVDLSPVSNCEGQLLVAFKCYFDGGNQADSTRYATLTLAAVSGTGIHWADLEHRWNKVLNEHGATYLHTVEALARQDGFKGWTETRVDALLSDCVGVIERCVAIRPARGPGFTYVGLRPATITVVLADYKRVLLDIPKLADGGHVEHICAVQAAYCCMKYGAWVGFNRFQFYFDQNEPFLGFIRDRINNRRSRNSAPDWREVVHAGESDSKVVPALQVADVFAWAVNHKDGIRGEWHRRVLAIDRDSQWLDYDGLMELDEGVVEKVASFKLPRRRPMK